MLRRALASRSSEAAIISTRVSLPRGSIPPPPTSSSSSSSSSREGRRPRFFSTTTTSAERPVDDDEWETVVGLELHVQIGAKTKLFSGAERLYGAEANANVAPFDAALPGSLPAVNARAVELAARLGFALGADVQSRSSFDRKHYHYPDLPHGYQITQQRSPIALGGSLDVFVRDGVSGTLRVERLQLEMDTGKSSKAKSSTLVDLNRAGSTLVEIVTAPDLRGAEEASAAAETFQKVVRFLGVGDANMEEGSMRVDVNVSHRTRDGAVAGERCEVKNLNSFRSIARAVAHERTRQIALLKRGQRVRRQTRSFDPATGATAVLRDKEALLDYRFAPEPDLPPVVIEPAALRAIKAAVPELPSTAAARLTNTAGLAPKLAQTIASKPSTVAYFDACAEAADAWSTRNGTVTVDKQDVANWVTGVLVGAVKRAGVTHKGGAGGEPLRGLPESAGAARVGELLARVAASTSMDSGALEATCAAVVASMPEQLAAYRGGRTRAMGSFVGEVMKRTKGRADPRRAAEIIKTLVDQ
ncbi:predicted protein [Micromonas commoda]|uniref:Glutamyl-tRNA(Gln) amidotransferase subunit B-2, chloroplastic/mitochondrial n=1 Tax=Micromonas commoda (strain RCC299 / NOUM17 / CCMP2709) TaxID=296587 RepID=GATB2_MICCC|nr:predicted protein [Micromonas commoda]C1FJ20.1 RecName: Full=Glutamyl-tRNA(Gln) amidotransferase subunit B-2, chloroplastic/mitochondrial; Short=Glu-AdT subunit B-2 [Micromonas commoda]ACO70513.1 predicted protein [Micromonas commoda]|eukprot:XP_002509255.1 predicted protein [Micromonas commoda]